MNAPDNIPEPSEIEALLPWHAAGTLDPAEKRMVEDAIARDPELARRYATVREEFNADWQINEGLGAPSRRAMDQLFARIDAEPSRRGASAAPSFSLAGAWAGFIDRMSSRTLLAAGLVALIAAGAVLGMATTLAAVAAGVALWGLHMGLTQGLLAAMVAHAAPAELRGTAFGVFNLAMGLAMLLASAIAGALWHYVGPAATFWCAAALAAASLVLTRLSPR